jgi:hypothetical protein
MATQERSVTPLSVATLSNPGNQDNMRAGGRYSENGQRRTYLAMYVRFKSQIKNNKLTTI